MKMCIRDRFNGNDSINVNYNEIENIERNIEERVSIIVYQAERVSSLIINKKMCIRDRSRSAADFLVNIQLFSSTL